jgi:hypothetical protein
MKQLLLLALPFALFISCSENKTGYQKAADAEEAGREFVRASLDGDYEKIKFFLYRDSSNTNITLLDKWRNDYNRLPEEDKISYKEASIIALRVQPVDDSTAYYVYTNSFKQKDTTTLRIVKIRGEWLVDFKDIH